MQSHHMRYEYVFGVRQRTGGEATRNPITLCHGHPPRLGDCHLPIAPIGLTWSSPPGQLVLQAPAPVIVTMLGYTHQLATRIAAEAGSP